MRACVRRLVGTGREAGFSSVLLRWASKKESVFMLRGYIFSPLEPPLLGFHPWFGRPLRSLAEGRRCRRLLGGEKIARGFGGGVD